jgi:hypothetical protein
MIARMTDESGRGPQATREPPASEPGAERSAVDDLTAGLGLVLKAARKVVQGVEPKKIEELGRRTFSRLDRSRVEELGRKAKQRLDPRHIEELAEDAGRELVRAVERVAERMESLLGVQDDVARPSKPPADAGGDGDGKSASGPAEAGTGADAEHPRVRIKGD